MNKRTLFLLVLFLLPSLIWGEEENLIQDKTLVVGLSPSTYTFNPLESYSATEAQLFTALYEGLVTYNPYTLNPVPGVAESWEVSPDGKTYTFFLRPNALYWNGDPVTANDFLETWIMLLDPEANAPYSFLLDSVKGAKGYRTGEHEDRDKIGLNAEDDSTFVIELENPSDPFLKILCHHAFVPLHSQVRDIINNDNEAPGLGNGPFFFYEREGQDFIFIKNQLYWDAANVKMDRISFLHFDDPADSAKNFNNGQVHWVMGSVNIGEIENTRAIALNPLFATTYYYFSPRKKPFDDPRVRRALALLIPWEEIRNETAFYTPATNLIPSIPGYPEVEPLNNTDEEEAMKLLKEAGYPKGEGLPTIQMLLPEGLENSLAVRILKNNWEEKINATVNIETRPNMTYYDSLDNEEYTLGTLTWIGDFADPLTFLQMWAADSNLNSGGFSSLEYDNLLNQAAAETGSERMETLAKAEELLLREGTVLPISHQPALNVIASTVLEGWYPNPMDIHPFKYMNFFIPEVPSNVVVEPRGGDFLAFF